MFQALSDKFVDSWDDCLPWILFAYREIPIQSLGFELLFGSTVEGPVSLLKSTWLKSRSSLEKAKPNVIKFMLDLRDKLATCQELAMENAK